MSEADDTVARFRERARECREMGEGVQEPSWLKLLLELAHDLDDEADKIEAERKIQLGRLVPALR